MADAVVHIGPLPRRDLIARFYERCGLETIGAGRLAVGDRLAFDTFEQLLENMNRRSERFHIIVNHATPTGGLIIPFTSSATYNATGVVLDDLLVAANRMDGALLANLTSKMGVDRESAGRLVQKLAAVRARQPFVEIRGCNLGADLTMLERYKRAFGAVSITAPNCRMFFIPVVPHKPRKGQTLDSLSESRPSTGKTRRRQFADTTDFALQAAGPIIIDVRDINGHANVDSESFMLQPANAYFWAVALNGAWQQAPNTVGSAEFVLPVLWDDTETTYHTPLEWGYRAHLARI